MRQVPCQDVEVEVQRDHCKVPGVTRTVRTAAGSVQSQLCLPASPLWRRQSRGAGDVGEDIRVSERWRSLTGYLRVSQPVSQSVCQSPPAVSTGEVHHAELQHRKPPFTGMFTAKVGLYKWQHHWTPSASEKWFSCSRSSPQDQTGLPNWKNRQPPLGIQSHKATCLLCCNQFAVI